MDNTNALSSITKKVIMSLAGLFLIIFLIVHLGINIFLLPIVEGNREIFLAAAEFMATFWPIKIMEVVLFSAFILHALYGIIVQFQNWRARGAKGYKVASKTKATLASKTMIYSGILVLLFLFMHIYQFYFVKLGITDGSMLPMGTLIFIPLLLPFLPTIGCSHFFTLFLFYSLDSIYIMPFNQHFKQWVGTIQNIPQW
jgi:succinate dehydrogenase/fumarate reductase cytochrome b subunit (b558 family)